MKYDIVNQVNRVKWHHQVDGKVYVEKLDVRCFFFEEMDYIIGRNWSEIVHKYGDFDKNEFTDQNLKQIYVLKRKI